MQDFLSALGILFPGILFWLALTALVGWLVYRGTESLKKGILTAVILFLIPTWDLLPGLTIFSRYSRDLAGVRIFKTVRAPGYLDLSLANPDFDTAARLNNPAYPYAYVEIHVVHVASSPTGLINAPGYWELSLVSGVSLNVMHLRPLRMLSEFEAGSV